MKRISVLKINGEEYFLYPLPTPEMEELLAKVEEGAEKAELYGGQAYTMKERVEYLSNLVQQYHNQVSEMKTEAANSKNDAAISSQTAKKFYDDFIGSLGTLQEIETAVHGFANDINLEKLEIQYYTDRIEAMKTGIANALYRNEELTVNNTNLVDSITRTLNGMESDISLMEYYVQENKDSTDYIKAMIESQQRESERILAAAWDAEQYAINARDNKDAAEIARQNAESAANRAEAATLVNLDETLDAILEIQNALIGGGQK